MLMFMVNRPVLAFNGQFTPSHDWLQTGFTVVNKQIFHVPSINSQIHRSLVLDMVFELIALGLLPSHKQLKIDFHTSSTLD